ncbi:Coiled-coil domain-containing protein 47 [Sorochytrium milnesiophthora]
MDAQSRPALQPAANIPMAYMCADCGIENDIKPKEPIRCKECGHRIMYKKRTKRKPLYEVYAIECGIIAFFVLYFANFFYGYRKNERLADQWVRDNIVVLRKNFAKVGDGKSVLVRDGYADYVVTCSGRQGCRSALIRLELLHRQDLVSVLYNFVVPGVDTVTVELELDAKAPVEYVYGVVGKKAPATVKSRYDLKTFARVMGTQLPPALTGLSEHNDVVSALFAKDSRFRQFLSHPLVVKTLDYLVISDQRRFKTGNATPASTGTGTSTSESASAVEPPPTKAISLDFRMQFPDSEGKDAFMSFACWLVDYVREVDVRGDVLHKLRKRRQEVLDAAKKEAEREQDKTRKEEAEKKRLDALKNDPARMKKKEEREKKKKASSHIKTVRG